jgi:hypothetical protein
MLDKQSLRYRRPESIVLSRMSVRASASGQSSEFMGSRKMTAMEAAIHQARKELDLAAEEKKDDAFLSGCATDENSLAEAIPSWNPRNIFGQWRTQRAIYKEDYRRSVEVANQALWYLGVFYLTHVWATTTRIIQQVRQGQTFFGVILVHSIFDPLQGFSNFVVYQRPRYLKIRKAHPSIGVTGAIWRALRFSYLPPIESMPTERSRWSTANAASTAAVDNDKSSGQVNGTDDAKQSQDIFRDDMSEVFA